MSYETNNPKPKKRMNTNYGFFLTLALLAGLFGFMYLLAGTTLSLVITFLVLGAVSFEVLFDKFTHRK